MNYKELTKLAEERIEYYMKEAKKFESPTSADHAQMFCSFAFGSYQLWTAIVRTMALNNKTKGEVMMQRINQQSEKFEEMMDKKKIPALKHLYKDS
ncbi:hypothetical protein AIE71_22760 [Salmonella enterica subsp. enterica]|nr:hypothetical protein [Salmonella enterica subsp. enterica]EEA7994486.1 hypothetical protein [Salmonella enterica subsp. enterica]